jgi:hypothetical protein
LKRFNTTRGAGNLFHPEVFSFEGRRFSAKGTSVATFRIHGPDHMETRSARVVLDANRRRHIHGPIQPMERPNLFRRMLGLH